VWLPPQGGYQICVCLSTTCICPDCLIDVTVALFWQAGLQQPNRPGHVSRTPVCCWDPSHLPGTVVWLLQLFVPPFPALLTSFSFLCQRVFCLCSDNLSQLYPIMPGSDDNPFAAHLGRFALMTSFCLWPLFSSFLFCFHCFSRFFFSLPCPSPNLFGFWACSTSLIFFFFELEPP